MKKNIFYSFFLFQFIFNTSIEGKLSGIISLKPENLSKIVENEKKIAKENKEFFLEKHKKGIKITSENYTNKIIKAFEANGFKL